MLGPPPEDARATSSSSSDSDDDARIKNLASSKAAGRAGWDGVKGENWEGSGYGNYTMSSSGAVTVGEGKVQECGNSIVDRFCSVLM